MTTVEMQSIEYINEFTRLVDCGLLFKCLYDLVFGVRVAGIEDCRHVGGGEYFVLKKRTG